MSSSHTITKCSKCSSVSPDICCPECRDVVLVDGEIPIESTRDCDKFVSESKGLNTRLKKMWRRQRELSDPNRLTSYEKFAIESIRNWEPTKGKRALLCGVTYNKQKYKLKGTDYDVNTMRELLMSHFRFPSSSIRVLSGILNHFVRI